MPEKSVGYYSCRPFSFYFTTRKLVLDRIKVRRILRWPRRADEACARRGLFQYERQDIPAAVRRPSGASSALPPRSNDAALNQFPVHGVPVDDPRLDGLRGPYRGEFGQIRYVSCL